MRDPIIIKGGRVNNLKNIDVEIPRNKMTVITGVSGSGKSSLAFDIIYSEAQRKFMDLLSFNAKSRMKHIEKADIDSIHGLSPAIVIDQKKGNRNPRSTVGSITDIINYLRLLYSLIGKPYCPYCGKEVSSKSPLQIKEKLKTLTIGTEITILAPIFKLEHETYGDLLKGVRKKGYRYLRINDKKFDIGGKIEFENEIDYKLEVIIDNFTLSESHDNMVEILEDAFSIGEGVLSIDILDKDEVSKNEFFNEFCCKEHRVIFNEFIPSSFSPNSEGACPTCQGLGYRMKAQPYLCISDENKSINEGAIDEACDIRFMRGLAKKYKFDLDTPYKDLSPEIKEIIFYGSNGELVELIGAKMLCNDRPLVYPGIIPNTERLYKNLIAKNQTDTNQYRKYKKCMAEEICVQCDGRKLKQQSLLIKIENKSISESGDYDLPELNKFILRLKEEYNKNITVNSIINDILKHLDVLIQIGVSYLTLNRETNSLSGGEFQRIKIAGQVGSDLVGMLYILDEPSIGLHAKDSNRIINILKSIRDNNNTVIVVEHDLETIHQADYLIELGAGAGAEGGNITAAGLKKDILNNSNFLTGQYLTGKQEIGYCKSRKRLSDKHIKIFGASENNLKNITVKIPLGGFVCVTGVSGSGKSSLINEILYKKLHNIFKDNRVLPGNHKKIEGLEHLSDIRNITQSSIGKSSRSNPATYVGLYDKIKKIFASLEISKLNNYTSSRFSFNNSEGRCEECEGFGYIKVNIDYMPDMKRECPVCKGQRFNRETLKVKYKGKSIDQVLNMSVKKAKSFFCEDNLIFTKLKVMDELGLGYLKLGQNASTLSGGESQRIKLAKEIGKIKKKEHNLYILDEPSTGLHMQDIQKLLNCINRLVDSNNSVIVIEHNLDIIKSADYIIDLGPEGGKDGGFLVAEGCVEEIVKEKKSYTGQYLKSIL